MLTPSSSFVPPTPLHRSQPRSSFRVKCHLIQSPPQPLPVLSPRPIITPIPSPLPFPRSLPIPFPPFVPLPAPSSRTLVWFRNDLRLHDHPALLHALHDSVPLPLFIFDPRHFNASDFGLKRNGGPRASFLLQAVCELKRRLIDMGSDLIIRIGAPEDVLPALAAESGVSRVVCHKEVGWEDAVLERSVRKTLEAAGVSFECLWANTLYHVDDLEFGENTPEDYAQFRQLAETKGKIRDALRAPEIMPALEGVNVGKIPALRELGVREEGHGVAVIGGEEEGLRRLNEFTKWGVKEGVVGSGEFMCKISPWLALGCVSPRRIYQELSQVEEGVRSINYFELLWRDFFRFLSAKCNQEKITGGVGERRVAQGKIPVLGFL